MHLSILLPVLCLSICCAHRHLLPKALIFEKEEGVDAVVESGEMLTPLEINLNFNKLGDSEQEARAIYNEYCNSIVHHSDDARFKRGLSFGEGVAVVATAVVGTLVFPIGTGLSLGMSLMQKFQMDRLTDELRLVYSRQILANFGAELDSLFFSHVFGGIFLEGVSQHFINSTGMRNMFEVRSRVSIHVTKCVGSTIYAHARHADPSTTVRGSLYLVADPGTFLADQGLYVYHSMPRELFLSEHGDPMAVEDCKPSVGSTVVCRKKDEVESGECSVYNYLDVCPRVIVNFEHSSTHVRRFGEVLIIASTKPAATIINPNGSKRRFTLRRGGITVMKLAVGEVLNIDNLIFHGSSSERTVHVDLHVSDVDHLLPSGVELYKNGPHSVSSRQDEAFSRKIKYTSIGVVIGVVVVLVVGCICAFKYYRPVHPQ